MKKMTTKELVVTAMFSALTLLATFVLKIQTPTFGYIHLGDGFVLLSGLFLGPVYGGMAAGIGSCLSDLIGGYAVWAPGTFVIKFLTAFTAALVFRGIRKIGSRHKSVPAAVAAGFAGETVMVIGYFLFNILIVSVMAGSFSAAEFVSAISVSATEIPFNIVQGAVGIILAAVLEPVFAKISSITLPDEES